MVEAARPSCRNQRVRRFSSTFDKDYKIVVVIADACCGSAANEDKDRDYCRLLQNRHGAAAVDEEKIENDMGSFEHVWRAFTEDAAQ